MVEDSLDKIKNLLTNIWLDFSAGMNRFDTLKRLNGTISLVASEIKNNSADIDKVIKLGAYLEMIQEIHIGKISLETEDGKKDFEEKFSKILNDLFPGIRFQ